uniref:Ubiquitin-like domain-containing protein n=1 Tax=Steinernema glaseri TaxID=37863 RepID=A0A1I8AKE3_9BILA
MHRPPPPAVPVAPQNKPPPPMFDAPLGAFNPPRPHMAVPLNQVSPHMSMMNRPAPFAADEGPSSKRARLESELEPEEVWLQKVSGSIVVQIQTPVSSEWKLTGNSLYLNVDVTETISTLKNKIQDCTEVPSSKIKLVSEVNNIDRDQW